MALISCPDCQQDVSDQAPACPKCGRPIKPAKTPQAPREGLFLRTQNAGCAIVLGVIALILVAVIYGVVSTSSEHKKASSTPTASETSGAKKFAPSWGEKLETSLQDAGPARIPLPARMVIAGTAEIFEKPDSDRRFRIGIVSAGKYLTVIEKQGRYYKSEFKEGGYFWIHEGYLKPAR